MSPLFEIISMGIVLFLSLPIPVLPIVFQKDVRVFTCVQEFILSFNPIVPFSTLYTSIKVSSLFNIMVFMQ